MKWLAPWLMGCALAAANDPAQDPADIARTYVEKLRNQNVNPATDTALSSVTDTSRRDQITKQLRSLGESLAGRAAFAVQGLRIDGEFCAVVLKQGNGLNPLAQRVVSIALVKRQDAWQPAPLPGSFTNTGAYFDDAVLGRISALEQWMAQEQTKAIGSLQADIHTRLKKAAQGIPADPRAASDAFLAAARAKNLDLLAAFIGGSREPQPDDWSKRAGVLETVCNSGSAAPSASGPSMPAAWLPLISSGTVVVLVHEEKHDDKATCIYALIDPAEPNRKEPRLQLLTLPWQRSAGSSWSLDLPPTFFDKNQETEEPDESDRVYLDRFPRALRKLVSPAATTRLDEAAQAFVLAVRRPSLIEAMAFADLEAEPATAIASCLKTAAIWKAAHDNLSGGALLLASEVRNDRAIACYGALHLNDPENVELHMVPWRQRNGQWCVASIERTDDAWKELLEWQNTQRTQLEQQWRNRPLIPAPQLKGPPEGEAVTEDAAKDAVQAWLNATQTGDLMQALGTTAAFERDDTPKQLLNRTSREILNARKLAAQNNILGVQRSGPWACISLKQQAGKTTSFPMLVVLATPQGPRVLPEIDLIAGGSRARDFLNEDTWKRLSDVLPADNIAPLRAAFAEHQKHAPK